MKYLRGHHHFSGTDPFIQYKSVNRDQFSTLHFNKPYLRMLTIFV